MPRALLSIVAAIIVSMTAGCSTTSSRPIAWAIAIHGGAGTIERSTPAPERDEYTSALAAALALGREELARGGSSLDAVEKVVRFLEDDPHFNAGKGAVYTYDGGHDLDAAIMDGATLRCGAVAGVTTVKNPISLARLVMERTPHVLLAGDGAESFATHAGVQRVDNSYFDTPRRREQWEKRRRELDGGTGILPVSGPKHTGGMPVPRDYGTVGAVALDARGRLAVATSTGGRTCKRWGRIGDTPIVGAGSYADAHSAISCTGAGEEFIRHGVARQIALLIEQGSSAAAAADKVVNRRLKPDDGGVIVVSRSGEIALVFNSDGMFRGAADANGRFEVAIWKETERTSEAVK